jgi:zinc/manganese transport system permease protein
VTDFLVVPFQAEFMRRALIGCLALSLAGPPLGVFLVLRRMSLMTDPLQHGILPGIAIGASLTGLSIWAMGLGGLLAGLLVAVLAALAARGTGGREDSQLAAVYLIALAAGVAILSARRGVDLTQLLFGSVLAVDDTALLGMAGVATTVLLGLALIWRPLVLDSLDAEFARATGGRAALAYLIFLALVVLAVVSGFVALGTLMSVGLMMLPAVAARHWSGGLSGQVRASVAIAMASSAGGLLLSYYADIPAGPAIVLTAGAAWIGSVTGGPRLSLLQRAVGRS